MLENSGFKVRFRRWSEETTNFCKVAGREGLPSFGPTGRSCCADGDRFVSLGECASLKRFLAQCKSEVRFSVGVRSVVNLAGLLGFRLGTSFGGNFGVGVVFLLTALLQLTT